MISKPIQGSSGMNDTGMGHEVRGLFMIIGSGGVIVLVAVVIAVWVFLGDRAEREAERERRANAERELAVENSETIRDLVAEHGFHTLRQGPWPMIPYPEDLHTRGHDWAAVSAHGDKHDPNVGADLRPKILSIFSYSPSSCPPSSGFWYR